MSLPVVQFRTDPTAADLILPAALLASGLELASPPHILQSVKLDSTSHPTPTGIGWSITGLTLDRAPLTADRARTTWSARIPENGPAPHPLQYARLLAENYRTLETITHRANPRLWIRHNPSYTILLDHPENDTTPLPPPEPTPHLAWHWQNAIIPITLGHTITNWGRDLSILRITPCPNPNSPYPLTTICDSLADPSTCTRHHSPLDLLIATLINLRILHREINSIHRLTAITTRNGGPAALISDIATPDTLDRVGRHLNL